MRVTLRTWRILAGERRRMVAEGSCKERPPVTLQRLADARLIVDVRRAGRWWVWSITDAGSSVVREISECE